MNSYTEVVGEKLNAIIECTCDAEKWYKKAAENVGHFELKVFFESKYIERKAFRFALKNEILNFDYELDNAGSIYTQGNRESVMPNKIFSTDRDRPMLKVVISGEKSVLENLESILKEADLPRRIATLIIRQRNRIISDLIAVKKLEGLFVS